MNIGIDLGTTNCALAYAPAGGDPREQLVPLGGREFVAYSERRGGDRPDRGDRGGGGDQANEDGGRHRGGKRTRDRDHGPDQGLLGAVDVSRETAQQVPAAELGEAGRSERLEGGEGPGPHLGQEA